MHQIGVGVLGPVYRAYEPADDRLVAVKAFHLDLPPEQAQTLVDALTRVVEAELSHPALVLPIAVGLEQDVPYLAQEYVAGESLDVAMRHYAPGSLDTVLPFIRQLAAGIDAAHERGVVHGGLHLRDIFVTPQEARTTGFGVFTALEEVGLRGPIRRPYTAPEMIAGHAWGPEADRFTLGAIAYELLTGKRAAGMGRQVTERLAAVEGVTDTEALQSVFARALADAPETRYSSAARFVSALSAAVGREDAEDEGAALPLGLDTAPYDSQSGDLLAGLELHRESLTPESLGDLGDDDDGQPLAEVAVEPDVDVSRAADEPAAAVEVAGTVLADFVAARERDDDVTVEAVAVEDLEEIEHPAVVKVEEHPDATRLSENADDGSADAADADDADDEIHPAELSDEVERAAADIEPDDDSLISEFADDSGWRESSERVVDPVLVATAGNVEEASRWSRLTRTVAPLVVLAAVAAGAAYFVGLRLGEPGPEEVGDQLLGSEEASVPASRGTRAVAAGDVELAPLVAEVLEPVGVVEDEPALVVVPPPAPPARSPTTTAGAVEPSRGPEPDTTTVAETGVGWVLVRTSPTGADVSVDGVDRGRTPLSLSDVSFGAHQVDVRRDGYETQTREVRLSAAAPVAPVGVALEPVSAGSARSVNLGSMLVDSRPPGARVVLDGNLVGTTPVVVPDIAVGTHRVSLEREGYQAWATTIDVSPSAHVRVAASLDRAPRR